MCAFPFDAQNVAYDSFVMASRVFWNHISFRVLNSVSEMIVNGDYSMNKVINLYKFIYILKFPVFHGWSDASIMRRILI